MSAINIGDVDAMETAISDAAANPEIAASVEAALGALATQVKEMQARLASMKAQASAVSVPALTSPAVPGSAVKVIAKIARPMVHNDT